MGRFLQWKLGAIVLAAGMLAAPVFGGQPAALKTDKDRVNYAIGVNIMGNFKQQGIEVDLDRVTQGMRDAAGGGQLLLNDEELRKAIKEFYVAVRQKRAEVMAKKAAEDKKGIPADPAVAQP